MFLVIKHNLVAKYNRKLVMAPNIFLSHCSFNEISKYFLRA